MPEFSTTFPLTVENVYKHSLSDLEGYLQGIYEFKAFRIPAKGELVLTSQYTIEKVVFQYDVPRLIIGDKPKPRRIVFEEVGKGNCIPAGAYFLNGNSLLYYEEPSVAFGQSRTIFKKVEDNVGLQ